MGLHPYDTDLSDYIFNSENSLIYFNGTIEPVICSHFGCAATLTLIEQLAGKKCIKHISEKYTDPALVVKMP